MNHGKCISHQWAGFNMIHDFGTFRPWKFKIGAHFVVTKCKTKINKYFYFYCEVLFATHDITKKLLKILNLFLIINILLLSYVWSINNFLLYYN